MKIVFITSCLETGKDGVGDYVRLLAAECTRRGHATRLAALNDPYISAPGNEADTLRLPAAMPWSKRVKLAREFVAAFGADFASLQFVCYGFHPRGVDFALAGRLRDIIGRVRTHVMLHELWIGMGRGAGLMERFVGRLQRSCVLRIMAALDVCAVHASNEPYVAALQMAGVNASVLPLFGSIPAPTALAESETISRDNGTLSLGMFGALHPIWPPEPLFSRLLEAGKKITVSHIGRLGPGAELWEEMTRNYARVIEFKKLGEQAPSRIAEFFRSEVDFGVATTPWQLIGKSATVAAMIEHGLPVIVNRDDWHSGVDFKAGWHSSLLLKMDDSLLEKLNVARRTSYQSMLPVVAGRLLGDLERIVL